MRVGINATWLAETSGGIKTYVYNLARELPKVDPDSEYLLYSRQPLPESAVAGIGALRQLVVGRGLRIPFATSLALARERVDVVHEQIIAPHIFMARLVITIHDTLHEHYPQFYDDATLTRMRRLIPPTVKRAESVITDSAFSSKEIQEWYQVPPEKIVVAPLAADPIYQPVHDPARLAKARERYGTGDDYILFSGNLKPTKNLNGVLAAYLRLRRAGATAHRLVLVGSKAWYLDDLFATVRDSGCESEIVFTGHVPEADLAALYSGASLFVQPSLFEGFGLPTLEAMACGAPVVTSNTSAIPEVVGDAAIMVDPLDIEALAAAMHDVLCNEELRARLSAQSLERAATFSWEKTARIVSGVYREVWMRGRRSKHEL